MNIITLLRQTYYYVRFRRDGWGHMYARWMAIVASYPPEPPDDDTRPAPF